MCVCVCMCVCDEEKRSINRQTDSEQMQLDEIKHASDVRLNLARGSFQRAGNQLQKTHFRDKHILSLIPYW